MILYILSPLRNDILYEFRHGPIRAIVYEIDHFRRKKHKIPIGHIHNHFIQLLLQQIRHKLSAVNARLIMDIDKLHFL